MTAVGVYHSPYLKGLRAQLLELGPWLQIMALPLGSWWASDLISLCSIYKMGLITLRTL